MKKYEAYKNSGIEWIGDIPEGWNTSKLKFETTMVLGKMLEDKEPKGNKGDYTQEYYLKSRNVGMLEVFKEKEQLDKMWFSNKEKELYLLQPGDLVMNEGGDIGKVALWETTDFACYIQNSVHKLTPKKNLYASFLQYLISHISGTGYFKTIVSAISIAHLTKEKLAETPLLIPSINEQKAIASYLDYKVGQIDASVSAIETQIDELKAYRQSIISEAVTKGLNPNVTMKDSGIEWIGEIPTGWNVIPMKHYFYMKGRIGWQGLKADEFIEEGPYLVTGTDFDNGKVCWERCYHISEERFNEAPEIHVQQGDLLITKDGTVGKLALIDEKPEKVSLNSHLLILRPIKGEIDNHFVYWALQSMIFKDYTGLASSGSTMASLSQEKIGEFPLLLPTATEQQTIANYLDDKTAKIDKAIASLEAQRADLSALKQSIISEAVTGKIDLREWNANT